MILIIRQGVVMAGVAGGMLRVRDEGHTGILCGIE